VAAPQAARSSRQSEHVDSRRPAPTAQLGGQSLNPHDLTLDARQGRRVALVWRFAAGYAPLGLGKTPPAESTSAPVDVDGTSAQTDARTPEPLRHHPARTQLRHGRTDGAERCTTWRSRSDHAASIRPTRRDEEPRNFQTDYTTSLPSGCIEGAGGSPSLPTFGADPDVRLVVERRWGDAQGGRGRSWTCAYRNGWLDRKASSTRRAVSGIHRADRRSTSRHTGIEVSEDAREMIDRANQSMRRATMARIRIRVGGALFKRELDSGTLTGLTRYKASTTRAADGARDCRRNLFRAAARRDCVSDLAAQPGLIAAAWRGRRRRQCPRPDIATSPAFPGLIVPPGSPATICGRVVVLRPRVASRSCCPLGHSFEQPHAPRAAVQSYAGFAGGDHLGPDGCQTRSDTV